MAEEKRASQQTEEATEAKTEKKKTEKKSKDKNEIIRLEAELATAKDELSVAKDQLLRSVAEFENYKRRTAQEKADIAGFVKAEVAKELIPVVDNIDRARLAGTDSDDYIKGLELIIKQLCDSLDKIGLKKIETVGCEFNPNLHEAIMHIEDESVGENTVVEELQAGYQIGDTVIRSAMVKVAN